MVTWLTKNSQPSVLLDTVIFMIGKGCALRAGNEHHQLCAPPFKSQFEIFTDSGGKTFIRYREDCGMKTNKGGLKHRKVKPKIVDIYWISDECYCPIRIILSFYVTRKKEKFSILFEASY